MREDKTTTDPGDLRDGEVAVELPARFDASLYYIGRIHTPWRRREDCPKIPAKRMPNVPSCSIRGGSKGCMAWRPSATWWCSIGWTGRGAISYAQAPHHYTERRGTFALRSPVRPNPIAVSVARLVRVDGNRLTVVGLDCVDDTPLLDLKPYFASTDSVPDASVGWHAGTKA